MTIIYNTILIWACNIKINNILRVYQLRKKNETEINVNIENDDDDDNDDVDVP